MQERLSLLAPTHALLCHCVTYVDVDTVATAHGNIVTISAPPLPLGEGGWGLGPTENNRRLVLNF